SRRTDHAKPRAVFDRRRAPLGERDDVVTGIHSLDGVPTKFVAIPLSFFSSHFAAPFQQSVQLHAQQTATGVEHNPLANLRRVDASQAGFSIWSYAKRRCSDAWKERIPGAKQTLNGRKSYRCLFSFLESAALAPCRM